MSYRYVGSKVPLCSLVLFTSESNRSQNQFVNSKFNGNLQSDSKLCIDGESKTSALVHVSTSNSEYLISNSNTVSTMCMTESNNSDVKHLELSNDAFIINSKSNQRNRKRGRGLIGDSLFFINSYSNQQNNISLENKISCISPLVSDSQNINSEYRKADSINHELLDNYHIVYTKRLHLEDIDHENINDGRNNPYDIFALVNRVGDSSIPDLMKILNDNTCKPLINIHEAANDERSQKISIASDIVNTNSEINIGNTDHQNINNQLRKQPDANSNENTSDARKSKWCQKRKRYSTRRVADLDNRLLMVENISNHELVREHLENTANTIIPLPEHDEFKHPPKSNHSRRSNTEPIQTNVSSDIKAIESNTTKANMRKSNQFSSLSGSSFSQSSITKKQHISSPFLSPTSRNKRCRRVHVIPSSRWERLKRIEEKQILTLISEYSNTASSQSLDDDRNYEYNIQIDQTINLLPKSIKELMVRKNYPLRKPIQSKQGKDGIHDKSGEYVTLTDKQGNQYDLLKAIGKGAYGCSLLGQLSKSSKISIKSFSRTHISSDSYWSDEDEEIVIKVGYESVCILWEVLIHQILYQRLAGLKNDTLSTMIDRHQRHFLPPYSLQVFADTSLMIMNYAKHGTLINVVKALIQYPNFSSTEHELIVMHITVQMLEALSVLHSCHIIHADIKTDNWVVHITGAEIRVFLIDFGKAKDIRLSSPACYPLLFDKTCNDNENHNSIRSYDAKTELIQNPYPRNHSSRKTDISDENMSRISQQSSRFKFDENDSLAFSGLAGAKGFNCLEMTEKRPWSYQVNYYAELNRDRLIIDRQADYYGVCACFHALLFFDELSIQRCHDVKSMFRQGYDEVCLEKFIKQRREYNQHQRTKPSAANMIRNNDEIEIVLPYTTLKRYWNRRLWTEVYISLLNHQHLSNSLKLDHLISEINLSILESKRSKDMTSLWMKLASRIEASNSC